MTRAVDTGPAAAILPLLPATAATLVEKTELTRSTVYATLKWLHASSKVFISAYEADSRGRIICKVWAAGRRKDAPQPGPRETGAERMRRIRAGG